MSLWLRTITLLSTPFSLEPGAARRDPEASHEMWIDVASRLEAAAQEEGSQVVADHAGVKDSDGHYATLSQDSLEHPVQLVTIRIPAGAALIEVPEGCEVQAVELRIFDHEVAIGEVLVDIGGHVADRRFDDDLAVALETLAHGIGQQVCQGTANQWSQRLADALDGHDRFVRVAEREEGCGAELLWTSRALFCDRESERRLDVAPHWLREADADDAVVEELVAGEREHVCMWLNYLFLDDLPDQAAALADGRHASEVWAGLRHAQYFYAGLEQVDSRLGEVLAHTHAAMRNTELAELRDELTDASHAADLIVIERQRTEKYLRRSVRRHMQDILSGWDTETLVEGPVRHKAELCSQRVAAIEGDLARRAGVWTDLILLGIAITSILGTALTVVSFGRSLGSDAGMAGYDSGSSGIIEWLASQPADAVLLTSLIVSVSLALIYVLYRRSSQS